ncbi:MAG: stage II sporulation protein M [Acidobacteriaceae bacterium]
MDALLQRVESHGLRSLSGPELRELGVLYRQTAADLSAARADRASGTMEAYLNELLGRAHNYIYSGGRFSFGSVLRFLARDYPRLFRSLFRYTLASLVLFLAGGVLGLLLTTARPQFMRRFLGPEMVSTIEHHQMWTQSIVGSKPQASSAILTNNISVTFMAFAGGLLAGIGTLYLLFFNGLQIGVISTACAQAHMSLDLWSFVAAHGALELPSIIIAGGAGLRLAAGLLFPGMLRRKDALAAAGSEAIRLLAGTVPLLIVAGILEGLLSPSGAPRTLKFAVCAALFTALSLWLAEGGRQRSPALPSQEPASLHGKILV